MISFDDMVKTMSQFEIRTEFDWDVFVKSVNIRSDLSSSQRQILSDKIAEIRNNPPGITHDQNIAIKVDDQLKIVMIIYGKDKSDKPPSVINLYSDDYVRPKSWCLIL